MTAARPAYQNIPASRAGSLVHEVADIAELYGRPLDDTQFAIVDCLTSYRADKRWAALESVILMARQNGKTGGVITPIVIEDLFLGPPDRIVWTAHRFKTARGAFEDIRNLIDGCDELRRRVKQVRVANGEEGIELLNGGRLDFLARSRASGRGLSGKTVVADEGLFMDTAVVGALFPVMAARKNPRLLVGSSAAQIGPDSDYLRSLIARGRTGGAGAPAYVEFCAPGSFTDPGCTAGSSCTHALGVSGCVLDREDYWRAGSPAVDLRVSVENLAGMRQAMPPREFAREFLGWHEQSLTGGVKHPLDPDGWSMTAVQPSPEPAGRPAFFITIGLGDVAVVAVAADRAPDGDDRRPHVELARRVPASTLPVTLAELGARWPKATFGAGKAGPVAGMVEAGLPVTVKLLTPAELAQACSHHERLHHDRAYTHSVDDSVDVSFNGAASKPAGDRLWTWDWRESTDLAAIAAETGALWLLETSRGDSYDLAQSIW